ncbi:hypothetical protein OG906_20395 [Streptomyces sp. NBC_01426]|uniref:hypothetical protein n=1 Tax=Streptomyces sp. NBC_01426 TaxID=2975866 RepID=UPI002E2EC59B|nr:hypothetical protein [Streptomyces sp. NBC_01426]
MHGPGFPPQHGHPGPPPSDGSVVTLRVLFAVLPVLTCGFLAWGTMLRLALVTRKPRDWMLLVVSCVLLVVWVIFIGLDKTPDTSGWQSDFGAGGTLLTGLAVTVYYLVADIRHHENRNNGRTQVPWYPAPAPYTPPQQQHGSGQGYGYPQGQTSTPIPNRPDVPPQVTPPRIGQVRAELDELSELLRNRPPQPNGPPKPGGPYQDPNPTATQDPHQ